MVLELCDPEVCKHSQSAPHIVRVPLDAAQHAHTAEDALGKGPGHDRRDGVVKSAHGKKGAKDGPVELFEQKYTLKVKIWQNKRNFVNFIDICSREKNQ